MKRHCDSKRNSRLKGKLSLDEGVETDTWSPKCSVLVLHSPHTNTQREKKQQSVTCTLQQSTKQDSSLHSWVPPQMCVLLTCRHQCCQFQACIDHCGPYAEAMLKSVAQEQCRAVVELVVTAMDEGVRQPKASTWKLLLLFPGASEGGTFPKLRPLELAGGFGKDFVS